VSVDPEHAARPGGAREAAERAECDRVVPAENERQPALVMRVLDQLSDTTTRGQDVAEKPNALVTHVRRLGDSGLNVPEVDALAAELLDAGRETLVTDRGGSHVHAAAARPEIEGSADHGHRA
jgi:hypothetical protein